MPSSPSFETRAEHDHDNDLAPPALETTVWRDFSAGFIRLVVATLVFGFVGGAVAAQIWSGVITPILIGAMLTCIASVVALAFTDRRCKITVGMDGLLIGDELVSYESLDRIEAVTGGVVLHFTDRAVIRRDTVRWSTTDMRLYEAIRSALDRYKRASEEERDQPTALDAATSPRTNPKARVEAFRAVARGTTFRVADKTEELKSIAKSVASPAVRVALETALTDPDDEALEQAQAEMEKRLRQRLRLGDR